MIGFGPSYMIYVAMFTRTALHKCCAVVWGVLCAVGVNVTSENYDKWPFVLVLRPSNDVVFKSME